ncbi:MULTISPECIES: right-handed parallel beta-helix repeat-containing protein [Rhizobium]|uniref:Uncharacterized protein n=1 Tax=Rhizobium tropici TaxID=398 RepID=A0A6P1CAF7_RHITR|nr:MULTISPECIES: right-handed parallel beta-helix repeat-containing protein [Rhizobium]AGB71038.1 hypothetical protein RTCIAT899_CH08240 [Rhizobium tropici CIAT 899]MBB4242370.1 hypothetical protein [Rhizobium tropici]MBB5594013.1 hypothetical protein [Rhizobium tropici]MBB6492867.1 hypothetical protein [Rhizobium tropici]NEV13346.1 hypothetical protein [Rhizobium tropici]
MTFSPNAETVYADGPYTDPYDPSKPEIRALLTQYENAIEAYSSGAGSIAKDTRGNLYADVAHDSDVTAWVYADANTANNGVYRKIGASGSGSWSLILPLPYSFIIATDYGAGTANAIKASTTVPVSESALIWFQIFRTNDSSPVTISFNGDAPLTIKTNAGNDPAAGGLAQGMILFGVKSGATFRLLNDQVSTAIVAAAEAAQAAAEAARDAALSAVPNVFALTRTALKALNTATITSAFLKESGREGQFVWRSGDYSAKISADSAEGLFIKANAIASTVGAWVRVYDGDIQATWFGAKADDATDNASILNVAIASCMALGLRVLKLPPGVLRFGSTINFSSSYFAIRGAGIGATTLRRTFADGTAIYCAVAAPNPIQSIALSDFSMDTTVRVTNGSMIYVESGVGVWLDNLNIAGGFWQIGLGGCFDVHLTNISGVFGETNDTGEVGLVVTTRNASYGGNYGGNIFVDGCSFRTAFGNGGGGAGGRYGIEVVAVDGLFVSNSYFGYFKVSAAYIFNTLATVYVAGIKFSNCWFDCYEGNGVTLDGGVSSNFSDIEFVGCSFLGGANAQYNFRSAGNPSSVRLQGCHFAAVNGDNIRIDTTGLGFCVTGNTLFAADMDNTSGGDGIVINSGSDFTICDNVINGNNTSDNGIRLLTGTRAVVSNNRIRNCINGISIAAAFNYYSVIGNITVDNSGTGIADLGGPNKAVANNV